MVRSTLPRLLVLLLAAVFTLPGCGGLRFVIDAVPALDDLTETTVLEDKRDGRGFAKPKKVALIDFTGIIADAKRGGVIAPSENPIGRFAEALRQAERDRQVLAIIVRINSPGGGVTASDVMYRELAHFRANTGKPVVVLMGDVAASGGYYLACAGDEIIAHPTTVTGSIGVIMQTVNFADGLQRIGIRADSITSGPNKAMGSPFAPMPPEHRELFQSIVNEFYAEFRAVVAERRPGIAESDLAWVTDGRVVTGRRAKEIGLVDGVGDLRDAFAAAKRRAGIERGRLVKYHRPLDHVGSAYASTRGPGAEYNLLQVNVGDAALLNGVGFYYLWDPVAWGVR